MTTDSSGLARPQGASSQDDYRSFCAALSESARGREFLTEFSRRNRNADTEMLLAGLDRLEALMRAEGTALERLRDELSTLLIAIRLARPDIDAASPLTKTAKLASLLDMLERRIETMVERKPAHLAPPPDVASGDIDRPPLSVVPPSDEPELPIPSPPNTQQIAPITLVRAAVVMPEVTFIASTPSQPAVAETSAPAPVEIDPPAPKAATALPPDDPLAAIMALSEAERIALFT